MHYSASELGLCEHNEEPAHSIKGEEFICHLNDLTAYWKDCAAEGWLLHW